MKGCPGVTVWRCAGCADHRYYLRVRSNAPAMAAARRAAVALGRAASRDHRALFGHELVLVEESSEISAVTSESSGGGKS